MRRGYLFLLMLVAGPALPQTVQLDDDRSKIKFFVRNFGLNVNGQLSGLSGIFVLNEGNPEKSHFKATVRAETVDTGVGLRDKHLRQENYLNVEEYPVIRIESKSVSKRNREWVCDALVTIKNVTKNVTMLFTTEKNAEGVIFKSNFTLNRLDFDVGGKSFSMDDTVNVRLEIAGKISDIID